MKLNETRYKKLCLKLDSQKIASKYFPILMNLVWNNIVKQNVLKKNFTKFQQVTTCFIKFQKYDFKN
jgi:hypothetical protein